LHWITRGNLRERALTTSILDTPLLVRHRRINASDLLIGALAFSFPRARRNLDYTRLSP
jgi:hypothetical protein